MPLQVIGVPLDVLALTKESQSQHGVRNEDFARYHRYLTNRIATLRRQTKTQQIPAATKAAAANAAKKRSAAAASEGGVAATFHSDFTVEAIMGMAQISTALVMDDDNSSSDKSSSASSAAPLASALSVALSLCPSRRSKASSAAMVAAGNNGGIPVVGGSLLTPSDNCSFIYLPPSSPSDAKKEEEASDVLRRQQQLASAATSAANKAAGGKYFEVIILSVERCWAEFEELSRPPIDAPATPVTSAHRNQARKRLNKAVKWCEKLEEIATSLQSILIKNQATTAAKEGDVIVALTLLVEFVVASITGYSSDMKARCAAAHNDNVRNAESLIIARTAYLSAAKALSNPKLLAFLPSATTSSNHLASEAVVSLEQTHALLLAKIGELDDRLILVESTTNKDDIDAEDRAAVTSSIASFRAGSNSAAAPTFVIASSSSVVAASSSSSLQGGGGGNAAAASPGFITLGGSISWFGTDRKSGAVSQIPVHNLRVKACLRQASSADPTHIARKLTALLPPAADPTSSKKSLPPLISLPCQRRINALFDRTIHSLNDALSHARQEGRSVGGADRKTASQVLHLYLQYQIARKTADRALFLLEVLMRRLTHMLDFIRTKAVANKCGGGGGALTATLDGARLSKGFLKIKGASRVELVQGSTNVRYYVATGRTKVPVVSPSEMSHIYDIALRSLEEMSHLPGVEGGGSVSLFSADDKSNNVVASMEDLINEQITMCKIGKLACAGAAWQFIGVAPAAVAESSTTASADSAIAPTADLAIPQALQTLTRAAQAAEAATSNVQQLQLEKVGAAVASSNHQLNSFYGLTLADSFGLPSVLAPKSIADLIDLQLLQLTIIMNTSQIGSSASGSVTSPVAVFGGLAHLKSITSENNNGNGSTNLLVPCFPAKPMPLVPKPVSIDIASIFISVPRGGGGGSNKAPAAGITTKKASAGGDQQPSKNKAEGGEKAAAGWLGGWGWKKGNSK